MPRDLPPARRNYIHQHKIAVVCSARSGSTKALGTTNLLLKAAAEAKRRPAKSRCPSESATPGTNGMFGRPSAASTPRTRSASPTSTAFSFTPLSGPPSGDSVPEFAATVDLIRAEHLAAAEAAIASPDILHEIQAEIHRDCDWLRAFLFAAQVSPSCLHRYPSHPSSQVIDEVSPRSRDSIIGFGERLACKLLTAVLRDQVRPLWCRRSLLVSPVNLSFRA